MIDTEDASLSSASIGAAGWLHPSFGLDVRNDDSARGSHDDDSADLAQLFVHLQAGVAAELVRNRDGRAKTWLVLRSSNGFHSPEDAKRTGPRAWYESDNLAALVVTRP